MYPSPLSGVQSDTHDRVAVFRVAFGGGHLGDNLHRSVVGSVVDAVANDGVAGFGLFPAVAGYVEFAHVVMASPGFCFLLSPAATTGESVAVGRLISIPPRGGLRKGFDVRGSDTANRTCIGTGEGVRCLVVCGFTYG